MTLELPSFVERILRRLNALRITRDFSAAHRKGFPHFDTDLIALAAPLVADEIWDMDTEINRVVSGSFPLQNGDTIVLEQDARRMLSWVPSGVHILTEWEGPPQPEQLRYQWAVADVSGRHEVRFGAPQSGLQYESEPDKCARVPFPSHRGGPVSIGHAARLRLIIALDAEATSRLEKIKVICVHKRAKG